MKFYSAIVLGLDSARRSGWSIFDCGEFRVAGPAKTADEREEVVRIATTLARDKGIPLLVGAEDWDMHGMSRKAIFGLGAGFGRWEHILEREGYDPKLLFRILVNDWRWSMLRLKKNTDGTIAKNKAMQYCKAMGWKAESHDAAEAAVVGYYFVKNPEAKEAVMKALRKMYPKKNGGIPRRLL